MKKVIFFNNKGGVGKTTFSFHLGCALEQSGKNILFVDADPQCNLSSWLCSDEVIQEAWSKEKGKTVFSLYDAVHPIISGAGDFNNISPYKIADKNIWIFRYVLSVIFVGASLKIFAVTPFFVSLGSFFGNPA